MNIKIGAKIKDLRKRDDITQEKLADVLGVTSQAISRWESENGYPDIEYITPIANFFNVTIDHLFGHDSAEKRRKIDDYITQYKELARDRMQNQDEKIDLMRRALAEFPAEEELLIKLAVELMWKWYNAAHQRLEESWPTHHSDEIFKLDSSWEEPVKIMEELLASSTNDLIRAQCRETLAFIYGCIGENEKLRAIAELCGSVLHARETILADTLPGDEGTKCKQELLLWLLHILANTIQFMTDPEDLETTIEAHLTIINLFKVVFRGDYGGHTGRMALLYYCYAKALREAKPDEAVEAFAQALAFAKTHDESFDFEIGEKPYTSPYLNRLSYNQQDFIRGDVALVLDGMKHEINQPLREIPKFIALVEEAEAWIVERG